jgi:hypothetical protein
MQINKVYSYIIINWIILKSKEKILYLLPEKYIIPVIQFPRDKI